MFEDLKFATKIINKKLPDAMSVVLNMYINENFGGPLANREVFRRPKSI
jgi:hypothetical protein